MNKLGGAGDERAVAVAVSVFSKAFFPAEFRAEYLWGSIPQAAVRPEESRSKLEPICQQCIFEPGGDHSESELAAGSHFTSPKLRS